MSKASLTVTTFGGLTLLQDGSEVSLPSSRKTRALLAYLIAEGGRPSRQSLCELFWDAPDDPLASLRWSLSKLRSAVNTQDAERLSADRKAAWFALIDADVDVRRLQEMAAVATCSEEEADAIWAETTGSWLEDCELPNQPEFGIWLDAQRNEIARTRALIARRFARDPGLTWQLRDKWAERWLSLTPYSREAAKSAFEAKYFSSGQVAGLALADYLRQTFDEAGITPPEFEIDPKLNPVADAPLSQEIRIVSGKDGVCIAWASVGEASNPPLIKAANWLNHLELDWESPIWSPLFRELSKTHRFIRYDERGCGLSDWDIGKITFDDFVEDLDEVVKVSGVDRFPLLGISQGAAVSIEYAARYPERVSKLILFGAYDCGWRLTADEQEAREREAVMVLTESGWGSDNPAYRHMFSRTFMPEANPEELDWFDEFQRQTTSPKNAVRFLEAFSTIDVRDRLADIKCPTLVVHSRGDLRIPFSTGRSIAARIPDAQFAGIGSSNHLLLGREKASEEFVKLVREFLQK